MDSSKSIMESEEADIASVESEYGDEMYRLLHFEYPPYMKDIGKIYNLLNNLTDNSISSLYPLFLELVKPQYYFEFCQIVIQIARFKTYMIDTIVNLLAKIFESSANLERLFITKFDSYLILRKLFKRGLYSKTDIERLYIRRDRIQHYFPDVFKDFESKTEYFSYYFAFEKYNDVKNWKAANLIESGYPKDCIQRMIKYDIDNELYDYIYKVGFDINSLILISPFECFNSRPIQRPETYLLQKTPLQLAAYYGSVKSFKLLLSMKAKINSNVIIDAIAGNNTEILKLCDDCNDYPTPDEILNACIKFNNNKFLPIAIKAKVTLQTLETCLIYSNYEAFAFLSQFCSEQISNKFLVEHNLFSILQSRLTDTLPDATELFTISLKQGNFQICQAILKYKPDITSQCSDGYYMIHYAAASGSVECFGLILKHFKIDSETKNNIRPLHIAISANDAVMVSNIIVYGADLKYIDKDGNNYLHFAAKFGNIEVTKLLIDNGVNINAKNNADMLPLDIAKTKHAYISQIVYQKFLENVMKSQAK